MEAIIIFGPQGCGKGTQAELLVKNLGIKHISTGQLLRDEISKETDLGKIAGEIINKGGLVSDEIILGIIKDFLEKNRGNTILFDGFPRNINQSIELLNILDETGAKKIKVINIDIPREESMTRLLKRAQIEKREDDNEETINKRLDIYYEQTQPILNFFKQEGIKIIDINGIGSIESIQETILNKLKE